jgi:hypothetical protein
MGLRNDLITDIAAETDTSKHLRRDNKLSSQTVFKIYEQLGIGEAGWSYDKTREDYLREICDHIDHDERKSMYGHSTPLSTSGLEEILKYLKKNEKKSKNVFRRLYT